MYALNSLHMLKTTFPTVAILQKVSLDCVALMFLGAFLEKIVHTYQDNAHSNHIAIGFYLIVMVYIHGLFIAIHLDTQN